MLFKIDKSEQERVTGSLNVTQGELVTLSFSEDGKEWTSYKMGSKVLHKILVDDREARDIVSDPDLQYTRLNGHSFLVGPKEEKEE